MRIPVEVVGGAADGQWLDVDLSKPLNIIDGAPYMVISFNRPPENKKHHILIPCSTVPATWLKLWKERHPSE